jgi:hypothetical protein
MKSIEKEDQATYECRKKGNLNFPAGFSDNTK